ncbi:MAG: hypothetical protein FJW32_04980, partial [Acidobacteria bacterium]|nr:hypothetical protein [Acidobacteriota bacterium]
MDISTEAVTRLTRDRKTNYLIRPVWSLDSRRVAIGELDGGIVEVAVDSGKSVPLAPKPLFARSWTPDGRSLIVSHGYTSRISSLTPGPDAKPSLIAETPYSMRAITLSPDGRTVAYISDESGE